MSEREQPGEKIRNSGHAVLYSFGFKHGTPVDATMVVDVRLLPNPYWVESLRQRSGMDSEVADYVLKNESGRSLMTMLQPLLLHVIRESGRSNRTVPRIAIGCTGGRHRSVAVVESLRQSLESEDVELVVFHRDRNRETEG